MKIIAFKVFKTEDRPEETDLFSFPTSDNKPVYIYPSKDKVKGKEWVLKYGIDKKTNKAVYYITGAKNITKVFAYFYADEVKNENIQAIKEIIDKPDKIKNYNQLVEALRSKGFNVEEDLTYYKQPESSNVPNPSESEDDKDKESKRKAVGIVIVVIILALLGLLIYFIFRK